MDASSLRSINQRNVLNLIYSKNETTRTELSKVLRISKPAIADNLESLIELGIVDESDTQEAGAKSGRRPKLLRVNKNFKHIIAIDLNYSNPVFALGDLDGSIISEFNINVSSDADFDTYPGIIIDGINILIKSYNLTSDDLAYIAVACPGAFDENGNIISKNPSYRGIQWSDIPFSELLRKNFEIDVIVENDIHAATLGEWTNGNGNQANSMLYVSCGVGLGTGIVLNSSLFKGVRFSAGSIYNYIDNSLFNYGKTLESELCLNALLARINYDIGNGCKTSLASKREAITFEDILEAYQSGDSYVLQLTRDICFKLSLAIINIVNLLNIDQVVFGGEYIVFGDIFIEEFNKLGDRFCQSKPTVNISSLGRYSGIHGLFYTSRIALFDRICNKNGTPPQY